MKIKGKILEKLEWKRIDACNINQNSALRGEVRNIISEKFFPGKNTVQYGIPNKIKTPQAVS